MIYLLLSILSSSLIFVVFKFFGKYKVNILQAIVANYFVACSVGFLFYLRETDLSSIPSRPWFPGTILLGILFILVFNLAAITTQRSGLSVVSVATKMSVSIPVLFGIFYYGEETGILKILGFLLALAAVYLSSIKKREGISIRTENLLFPALVFLGSGIIDTSIKFLETSYVDKDEVALFSSSIFGVAGMVGIMVLIFQAVRGKLEVASKNILGGIALGIPNFFSIYFLVMALRSGGFESSTIFIINNVAIVLVSTLLGIAIFKERLLLKNWLGIALAVLSILLVVSKSI